MSPVRAVIQALLAGAAAGGLAVWPVGAPWYWGVVLAVPVATVVLLSGLLSGATDANWEAAPEEPSATVDLRASMLATRLAEAAEDPSRFGLRVRPRLRRLATAELRRRTGATVALTDPLARRLLGAELHTLLTDERATLPSPKRLAGLLARLEDR